MKINFVPSSFLLCFALFGAKAQVIQIPDPNFKAALIERGVDANRNGQIELAEAQQTKILYVQFRSISNLQGIEHFTNLTLLDCRMNSLKNLNVRQNKALTYLDCNENLLTELDVSQNTQLTTLYCQYNKITKLDLTNNTLLEKVDCFVNQLTTLHVPSGNRLTYLSCGFNPLTGLDVSSYPRLKTLACQASQLSTLDVSKNVELTVLYCGDNNLRSLSLCNNLDLQTLVCWNNPFLTYVYVPDSAAAARKNWLKSSNTSFRNCSYPGQVVSIPDPNFKIALQQQGIDANADGQIQYGEAFLTDTLIIKNKGIKNLAGIQAFVNLKYLDCSSNLLTNLDSLPSTINLRYLDCSKNQLTDLDLAPNTKLEKVFCQINKLDTFVLTNSPVNTINCTTNQLVFLDVRKNPNLNNLWCYNNPALTTICVSNLWKAATFPQYKKDPTATWNNCWWIAREEEVDSEQMAKEASILQISLYPNPAKRDLFVRSNVPVTKLAIKDLAGTHLLSSDLPYLDIASLRPGLYLVEIETLFGKETSKLVVE